MNSAAIIGLSLLQLAGVNDITINNGDWLSLGEKDPYVWMNVPQTEQQPSGVLIDYQITKAPEEYAVEVYYSTNLHSFSEKFKHYFELTTKPNNQLYIPVDLINDESLQVFRLDFDQCNGCKVKLNKMILIPEAEAADLAQYQPLDYESKINQKRLITAPDDRQLPLGEPFIWKSLPESAKNAKAVLIEYQIKDAPTSYRGDLYYSTNLHLFSESLKYSFELSERSENSLLVPIDLIDGENLRAIMFDIKDCPGCRMQLKKVELLDQTAMQSYEQFIPADYQSHLADKKQNISANGMRIALQDFSLKDLQLLGNNKVKVTGIEPRLDSPPIELKINDFAGLYLRLRVPASQKTGMYIDIDWSTNRHGHRKKIVSRWSGPNQETAQLFIPFDPISAERWLKYFWVRFEPQLGDEYSVEEILIVTKDKRQEFQDLSPSLANFPGAVSSLPGLIKGGIKRMLKDWGFLIVYGLILILVATALGLSWWAKLQRNSTTVDKTRI